MSSLLDHPLPTLPPPPQRDKPRRMRLPSWSRTTYRAIGVAAALLFAVGMWLFYFSSVFALDSLVIEGVRTVSPTEIGAKADLGAGTPLARINGEDVAGRVMGISSVASVQVERRWPNTVVIKVVERDAVAALAADDRFETLDATGFVYLSTKKQPKSIPVVQAVAGAPRDAAIAVSASLPTELRSKIETISVLDPQAVLLTTNDGVTVMWGPSEENGLKAQILAALLKKTDDKWIDLRLPSTPTSAQSSPKPAPPPAPEPTPTPGAADGTEGTDAPDATTDPLADPTTGSEVPVLPGVVPSSVAPIP